MIDNDCIAKKLKNILQKTGKLPFVEINGTQFTKEKITYNDICYMRNEFYYVAYIENKDEFVKTYTIRQFYCEFKEAINILWPELNDNEKTDVMSGILGGKYA